MLDSALLYIFCKRRDCDHINIEYLNSLNGELFEVKARHHHATQKNYKPFIDKKDGSVASTAFINELKLKLGAKIMLIHNIDTSDCLTNGQLGVLVSVIKTTKGDIDKLIIKLNCLEAGAENRKKTP